jgi:hypothetical protein
MEATMSYTVKVGFDEHIHRYFVIASEIPGLNIETETFEEFVNIAQDVVPDLLGHGGADVSVKFEREVKLVA